MLRIGIACSLKPTDLPTGMTGPDDQFEEFDRPETVESLARIFRGEGHEVVVLGDGREFLEIMLASPPDFVFNIAEGRGAARDRESRVPSVCQMLGVPYSGSDPLTLALALDKDMARTVVVARGGLCPGGISLPHTSSVEEVANRAILMFDESQSGCVILKPAFEGSSKGIRAHCLAETPGEAVSVFHQLARDYSQPVLMEEFIEGDEITVGVLGNGDSAAVLGVMRIVPTQSDEPFIYSLEVKRDWANRVRYEAPPVLPSRTVEAISEAALLVYSALGCRDLARIDFRLEGDSPFFIEANPLPGLAPVTSDLVILSEGYGIGHDDLIRRILSISLERVGLTDRARP